MPPPRALREPSSEPGGRGNPRPLENAQNSAQKSQLADVFSPKIGGSEGLSVPGGPRAPSASRVGSRVSRDSPWGVAAPAGGLGERRSPHRDHPRGAKGARRRRGRPRGRRPRRSRAPRAGPRARFPAAIAASAAAHRARPRATSRPSGSTRRTASPARKSPRTPRTPTDSTLLPLARTASAAPRSSDDVAARAQRERDPVLLRAEALAARRRTACPRPRPRGRVDDACRRARRRRRRSPPRASRGAPPRPCSPCRRVPTRARRLAHVRHRLASPRRARPGCAAPSRVEEPVDVAQQHDEVGVDERRDHRRELVVVAELDLLDGDRVVLVEDGDGAARRAARRARRARCSRARGRRGRRA